MGRLPFAVWWRRRRRVVTSGRLGRAKSAIARISSRTSSRRFFTRYVARRQPVILDGRLPELSSLPDGWWATDPAARALEVQVEVRDGPRDTFGRGRRVRMRYDKLLRRIGDGMHYLTTQEAAGEQLFAPPLTAFAGRLPLRPKLLDTLVPQSINMWLGRTETLTSSGLHHDYHDNLYVLLSGRKRFRLFPPSDAPLMQTVGTIAKVHPNGRICYEGELTEADGRTAEDSAVEAVRVAKQRLRRAERELAEAEEAVDAGRGPSAAVDRAEELLEKAMDGVLAAEDRRRRMRVRSGASGGAQRKEEAAPSTTPPNFSRFGALQTEGGRLPAALRGARLLEFELRAGQMLFLPAGWFHEVCSVGEHCALNYWFHPPDTSRYERPYRAHDFWRREWRRTLRVHADSAPSE